MKKQKLGLALAALCVPLVGATALTGSAFADGDSASTTYTAADFGNDEVFFNCIKKATDTISTATEVTATAVQSVETLSCYGGGAGSNNFADIKNISGINLFTSLQSIYLNEQEKLETVNLSGNTTLKRVEIQYTDSTITHTAKNTLSSVTFNNNTSLENIKITNSNLATIDLSGAPNVTYVTLFDNELTSVNVSKNTELTTIVLSNNNLTSIDLSNNKKLSFAYLYNNNFTEIDISKILNTGKTVPVVFLDDTVLLKTNFVAVQTKKGGNYYASPSTSGTDMFIKLAVATGLSTNETIISTPGATFYYDGASSENKHCAKGDVECIIFDADILNYQNYIQLKYVGDDPQETNVAVGKDSSKLNYRLKIDLQDYDPNILVPDTGFFTGEMDGTKAIIYVGAAVLGAGALYLAVYSAKRSLHRNRFRK